MPSSIPTTRTRRRPHPAARSRRFVTGASVVVGAAMVAGMSVAEAVAATEPGIDPTPAPPATANDLVYLRLPDGTVLAMDRQALGASPLPTRSVTRQVAPMTRSHGSR